MKILIVANGIIGSDPSPSGGDFRVFMLAKCWESMGHEVEFLGSEACQHLIEAYGLRAKLHILPWNGGEQAVRMSFIVRAIQAIFRLPRTLRNFRGVVYSANDSLFDVISGLKLKLHGAGEVTWIACVHYLPPFPPWKRQHSTLLNSFAFFVNQRLSMRIGNWFADALFPVSESIANQVQHLGVNTKKIYPAKCGVQYGYIRSLIPVGQEKQYDCVFMGRLQGPKGAFDLVKIWTVVTAQKPGAKLLVIGDEGEDGIHVRRLLKDAGIDQNVTFTGFIYEADKKIKALSSAKTFVLPSYVDNWSISLGEALCCGIPVIAYDLKELVAVWGDNVSWVPVGDFQAAADRILQHIGAVPTGEARVHRGLAYMEKLDWDLIAREELAIFQQLAGPSFP